MNNKKVKKIVTKTTTVTEEIIETNGKTHIVCILDRSGSMRDIIDDSIGGFNSFIKTQKELGDDAVLTVILFDDKYDLVYDAINIAHAVEITPKIWFPRGWTGLYDAIGKTITTIKAKENTSNLLYDKTLVCIVTDGGENNSKEYNSVSIKKMISESEKDGWEFIYLGAKQDAFAEGGKLGVSIGNTMNYHASTAGVYNAYNAMTYYTTTLRSTGNGTFNNNNSGDVSTTVNVNSVTTKAPEAFTYTTAEDIKSSTKQQLND